MTSFASTDTPDVKDILFFYLFFDLFIYLLIFLFIYLFTYLFIYLFTTLFNVSQAIVTRLIKPTLLKLILT